MEQSCLAYIVLYTANKILQNRVEAYAILVAGDHVVYIGGSQT